MSKLDSLINNKIAQNLFIWFFLFVIFLSSIQSENRALTSFYIILLLIPGVYINNLFILPFFRKRIFLFSTLFIINTLLFTTISVYLITIFSNDIFEWDMFINFLGIMILVLVFASTIKIARDSLTRQQHEKEAQLKLLKAQLNPHFLFNTLNNLYGLSVIKSDKLPNLMLKLSDLLRYSLYDTKDKFVPLEKEITYLENYMSLEDIRLEEKTTMQFIKDGNVTSKMIAPMLLIVFVENAFKHLGNNTEHKSYVNVDLKVEDETLYFKCENTFNINSKNAPDLEKGKSGIGLNNAKKRLALIYPEKHDLNINEQKDSFSVELKLELI